eukprot:9113059-Alexandrium_andersonii.AAC.1
MPDVELNLRRVHCPTRLPELVRRRSQNPNGLQVRSWFDLRGHAPTAKSAHRDLVRWLHWRPTPASQPRDLPRTGHGPWTLALQGLTGQAQHARPTGPRWS